MRSPSLDPMEPRDLGRVVSVGEPAVSPDGTRTAIVVTRTDLEANRNQSAIWLVATADGATHQLTAGDRRDGHPTWSPTGDRLAFTRSGPGEHAPTQILVLPVADPGEPVVVATLPESVDDLDWSPDGTRIAFCSRVPDVVPGTADRDRPPRRITHLAVSIDDEGWTVDRRRHVHVALADGSAAPRAITAGPYDHSGPRWSPDGRTLAVAAARHDDWDLDERADLWLLDPDPTHPANDNDDVIEPRRVTDGTKLWSHPSWSPDGSRLAAIVLDIDLGWRNSRLAVVDPATGEWVDTAPGVARTFAPYPGERAPIWVDGGTAVVGAVEDRGRVVLLRLAPDGSTEPEPLTDGDQVVIGYDHVGGVLATVVTDTARLGELEVADHRTSFTADFVTACPPAPVRRFAVPSPAGDGDIDAWLITPDGLDTEATSDAGSRWPLLLAVHGGPMSQYGDRWFDEFQLLAGAGFAVVAANPHGSSGRDDAFARAIRSPRASVEPGTGWGGIDADDLLAVVDATLERWPCFDPARVGVLGGSYGGFMTSWLLARTDRFAAGCSERAVNNLLSEEWSSDMAGTFHRELGVSHLEEPDEYLRMSPVTYARDLTAPILILHSEHDLRCHPEQADALFTALRLLGHPDVEYWRFPGEGHELSRSGSPFHRVRRAELINAFFERAIGSGPV